MALKSWTIGNFPNATTSAPETLALIGSASNTIILFSLLISNYSNADDAHIVCEHTDGANTLFKFIIDIPKTNSPFATDSKVVLEAGDVLNITSDITEVSVIASGEEMNV